jgi:hypothetical protein
MMIKVYSNVITVMTTTTTTTIQVDFPGKESSLLFITDLLL